MRKLLFCLIIMSSIFAANYTGFNSGLSVAELTDVTVSTTNMSVDHTTGLGSIAFTVKTNLDNWLLLADSDYKGLKHTTKAHVLTSNVDVALATASPTSYQALCVSTDTQANRTVYTGTYCYSTPQSLKFYVKVADMTQAKVGYYTSYINLKVLTQ
ncbi:MAG: hypothetical protein PHV30_11465 [Candidatus Margulisbacteria bacterium]|nr:hypothetical protein [Candidatus Margulisiibacteriota bacterium]